MVRQMLAAGAVTALALFFLNLGGHVGGVVGGLIWCLAVCVGLVGCGWLLGLALNYKEWFK
jgi:hypothetical protein